MNVSRRRALCALGYVGQLEGGEQIIPTCRRILALVHADPDTRLVVGRRAEFL